MIRLFLINPRRLLRVLRKILGYDFRDAIFQLPYPLCILNIAHRAGNSKTMSNTGMA